MARFRGDSSTEATWEEINKLKAETARLLDKLNKYKTEDMEAELFDLRMYEPSRFKVPFAYIPIRTEPYDGETTGLFQ